MKKGIKETVRELVTPVIEGLGYEVWDITYQKVGADYHLEITIDSERGINIEDCEKVHRAIDPILDEQDPIESFYYLDVSSPGIERELRTDEHIALSIGEKVEVRLFAAQDGRKSFTARLTGFSDGALTFLENDVELTVKRSDISKLTTVFFD